MKKLLSAALVLTMGVTCAGSLAACGGESESNDAEVAKKAIASINSLYEGKKTIDNDYTVLGQTKVDGELYNVNWSVSSATFNNLNDYVKVSAEMNDKKEYTVSVTKAETAIEYKLKASVTVGKETATAEYERAVTAKSKESQGTLEDPYSASYAKKLASKLEIAEKYAETDEIPLVYVKGYVVDCGRDSGTRVGFVYIADTYAEDKDKNSEDAIMILSINYGEILKSYSDLGKGDLITVSGFLMNYLKAGATGDPQPEVTYKGSTGIQCHALEKAEDKRTDDQKIADALEAVNANMTINRVGETALPLSDEEAVTFAWALKSGDAATVADDKVNVAALPTEDKTVVVTVTATCGSATSTKDVTITIKAAATVVPGASGSLAFNDTSKRTVATTEEQVWVDNGVTFTNSKGSSTSNVNTQYTDPVRCYKNSSIKVEFAGITKIVFHSAEAFGTEAKNDYPKNLEEAIKAANISGATVTVSGNDVIVEFATAVTSIEFVASINQIRLMSIDVNPAN